MRVGKRSCDLSTGTTAGAAAGAGVSAAGPLPPRVKVELNLPLIRRSSGPLADADAANRERSGMIALQPDQTGGRETVIRVGGKLAGSHAAFPFGALELVFDHLGAVEPVLDVVALDHEARLVPVIERQHHPGRCAIEPVGGPGGGESALA